jgi:hypothetical protein
MKAMEIFRKNIHATVNFDGRRILLVNFHLKANFDADSIAVRGLEAVLIQALVRSLTRNARVQGTPYDAVVMVGDYNDFDHSFPNAFPAQCESNVLARISSGQDIVVDGESDGHTDAAIKFENALAIVDPIDARVSAVYNILIDHILYAKLPNDSESTKAATITAKSCHVQHRRDDVDENTRTSDHWPVTATFAFK